MRTSLMKVSPIIVLMLLAPQSATFNCLAQHAIDAARPAPAGYHQLKRIELGGEGGWDYLTIDGDSRRLYISRGKHVVVVDIDKGAAVGDIPANGVHGIAIAPELNRGFISNGADGTVTIFDTKTLQVVGSAAAGKNPDAIMYDPASKRVFAFNGRSNDATAIDAATGAVAGTIPMGGKPEFAVADGKGMVYANVEDKNEIVAIDSKALTVKAHWSIAPGEEPSGLAMDLKTRRLFAGCGNKKMVVVDADSGKVVTTLPIGDGVDACAFDPGTNLAFSSNGEGTLTVVHEDSADKFSVVENAPTEAGARTMALDPKTHNIFLATAKFGPPPAATAQNPHPRRPMVPGSFVILVFGK